MRFLLILAGIFLLTGGFTLGAAEIHFQEKARVTGEFIRLADIASVHPRNREEAQRLEEMLFGLAPAANESLTLDPDYLRRRLEQFGFWGSEHHVDLPVAPLMVRRSSLRDRQIDVETAVKLLVERHYGTDVSRVEVSLEDPGQILSDLPIGEVNIEILDLDFLKDHSHKTRLTLIISIGEKILRGNFPVDLRLWRREVFSATSLGTRMDVRESELEFKEVELVPGLLPGCRNIEDIVGRRLGRLVPAGRRLLESDVLALLAIQKGEKACLEKRAGDLVIRIHARALDEGRPGDVLPFEMANGTRLRAEVTGPGQGRLLESEVAKKRAEIVIGGHQP